MQEFSGKIDQRIILQLPADTEDGGGGAVRNWQTASEHWAQVIPRLFDEQRYAGHTATHMRYDILLRRDGMVPLEARLLWQGRLLTILAVNEDPATPDRCHILAEQERER
jgi:SPP1 family predicted phage head-tail adaptor